MPRKKTVARRRRRTRRRKRSYVPRSFGSLARNSPVPIRFPVKMTYVEQFTINPGAGTCATYVFSGNGLYDPNITGTGHQPRGFDQLMALYDHYVVVGSKATCKYSTADVVSVACCLAVTDSGSTSTDINNYMEHRTNRHTITGADSSSRTLTIASSPRTYLGRSKVLSDPELKGTSSANPSEGYFFHVAAEATDGSSDPGSMSCLMTIEYSVVFIEPKRINQS